MADYKVFYTQEIHVADDDDFVADGSLDSTFDDRLKIIDARVTLTSGKAPDNSLQSRLFKTEPGFNLGRSGTIEIDFYLFGAGADVATGALPTPAHYKMIRDGLGGGDASQIGGVAGATATTTNMPNATGTRVLGGLARVGQLKDDKARGQPVVWNATTGTLVAMAAAPGAADVIRPCLMVYPKETPGPTKRFLVAHTQEGMQYILHGCQVGGFVVRTISGAITVATLQYQVMYWRPVTVATPTAEVLEPGKASVANAGSYVMPAVGSTTRTVMKAPEMEITLNLGLAPITGPGGVDIYQGITDWVRIKASRDEPAGTLRLTMPFDPDWGVAADPDGSDSNFYHFLFALSAGEGTTATEGRHVCGYMPLMTFMERPGPLNWQDLTGTPLMFRLDEGPDTTNDLTKSFFRLGLT